MDISPRAISSRFSSLLRSELRRAIVRTFIARGITALGSFALIVVLARLYGTHGVGVFALAQSVLIAAAIFGRYGMDNALMRFVGRDPRSLQVKAYLRRACLKAFFLSLLTGGIMFLTRSLWARWFNAPDLAPVLVGFSIATPAFTLAFVLSGFMRGIRRPAASCFLRNGGIALVTAAIVPLFNYLWPSAGIMIVGVVYAVAAWLILGLGVGNCWQWFRHVYDPETNAASRPDVAAFNRSSAAFFVSSLTILIQKVLVIWLAGYFLVTSDVGLFKAAQQIAMLIGFILVVMNAVFPARFASLFFQGDKAALASLARRGVLLGLALASVPSLVCLVVPGLVLGLVGHDFSGAENLLRILAAAQLVTISCGSAGYILNMAGREAIVRNVQVINGLFAIVIICALTPFWGVMAIAIAVAVSLAGSNLANIYFVWRKLGIWALPTPNILRMAGVACKSDAGEART